VLDRIGCHLRAHVTGAGRLAALALLLGMSAACGPLPRPFVAEHKADNNLLHLADSAGVVVAPVVGTSPLDPAALAEAMAANLRRLNVPAATASENMDSRLLQGRATLRRGPGGLDELILVWELWDLDGRPLGSHTQRRLAAPTSWRTDAQSLIDGLAAQAAPAVAAMVQDPAVEQAAVPGFPHARLVVLPLDAGPGDSRLSLPNALRAELAAAGLPVLPVGVKDIGDDDLLVRGKIDLAPAAEGQQDIVITWAVLAARDHAELGQVAQRNRIPAGSLDGPWGPIAGEIARGAADGVVDLLKRRAVQP
jgi:hypothetical protein